MLWKNKYSVEGVQIFRNRTKMREYPVTVPNVFRINSNASNLFDADKFPKTLKVSANGLVSPFHQPSHQPYMHQRSAAENGSDLSKSYHISSNHNINNNNNECHQSDSNNKRGCNDSRNNEDRRANASSAYSLLDAITNVVTTGNCSGTIYPVNEPNEANCTSDDKLFLASHQQHQHQRSSMVQEKLTTPLINSTVRHHSAANHNRDHQFPSVNYKNSYLLWIGTPVAAR